MRDVNVLEVGSADAILAAVLLLLVIVCCHDVFATFLMASSMEVIQFKKKKGSREDVEYIVAGQSNQLFWSTRVPHVLFMVMIFPIRFE